MSRPHGALAGGNDHRKIFGPTPGQHRVDRGLLDGQPPVVRRHFSEQFAWRASGTREHPFDALPGRRHDRESVGHAFVEPDLEFVRRHRVRCELAATISDNSSRADNPLNGSVSENRIRDAGCHQGCHPGWPNRASSQNRSRRRASREAKTSGRPGSVWARVSGGTP